MKKYLTTTAVSLVLASSPALANSSQTDITQILDGLQEALNSITTDGAASNLSQTATNAGNLINRGAEDLDDIEQVVNGIVQDAANDINATGGGADVTDITQDATNVLNSLTVDVGGSVNDVDQDVAGAAQTATNDLDFDGDTDGVAQAAVNAANLVSAEGVNFDERLDQQVSASTQDAANVAFGDDGLDDLDNIVQDATNVANSVTIEDSIDVIDQDFDGSSQTASNLIDVLDDLDTSDQTAVNAANIVSLNEGDTITQGITDATQTATNEIDGFDGLNDDITDATQSATNVANSINAAQDPGNQLDTVIQSADLDQVASNTIDYNDEVNNVSQTATNAANIATFQDIEVSVSQTFFDDSGAGAGQLATNVVDEGSTFASTMTDLTQSATNVMNSLSGDSLENGPGAVDVSQIANTLFDNEDQVASNFVSFGTGGVDVSGLVDSSFQTATNVANTISVEELRGTTVQLTDNLDQDAINLAVGFGDVVGGMDVVDQAATNASNLITAAELPNLAGSTDITQTSLTIQTLASNTLTTVGGVSDFAQSAVNVANSVGLPSN